MKNVTRLYDHIKPINYKLDLTPNFEDFSFKGEETISFELMQPSKELTFHASELEITQAKFNTENNFSIQNNKDDQTVTFKFEEQVPTGTNQLQLTYSGQISDSLHGWYRSKYQDGDQTKWLATTQLEATAAREVFVCIDEPSAKATFDVTLKIDPRHTAISNTEIIHEEKVDGKKALTFAQTPIMSTYLLAFLVGEFEYIETQTSTNTRVRVYSVPGKSNQGAYALDVTRRTLEYYESYFGIKYPLNKIDMVAIPDFAAAAMENWGAVTYRESMLLLDKNTSLAYKQLIAMVIAHELAHQWFGNLVTMEWWTDLWLNEGFASWVEYLSVDHLFPEWQMWTQFVTDEYAHARDLDALDNTHPIEVEVNHPREVDEIFDAISYQKGASVIRMLNAYLGEEDFKKGLHDYLVKYSYSNAVTADLWQSLEEASGKPVSTMMSTWTSQPGHPVVWFDREQDGVTVRQERFYANGKVSGEHVVWPLPLDAVDELFDTPEAQFAKKLPVDFKPNLGQTGFYVVGYTDEWLKNLAPRLSSPDMDVTDKFGVLTDTFDLIKSGKLSSVAGLELVSNLRNETDLAVWNGILDGLGSIMGITDEEAAEHLEEFGAWLAGPRFASLGWEAKPNESHFDTLLRPRLIGMVGKHDNKVLGYAQKLFNQVVEQKIIDADIRGVVYALVARMGDEKTYEQLHQMYKQADSQEEEGRLMRAMANFKQPELARRTLEFSLSDEVRAADSIRPLLGIVLNRFTGELGWQFVQDNWDTIVQRYGTGGHLLSYFVDAVGGAFNTTDKVEEIEKFFASHPTPGIERKVKQAIERTKLRSAWRERDLEAVKTYLTEHDNS